MLMSAFFTLVTKEAHCRIITEKLSLIIQQNAFVVCYELFTVPKLNNKFLKTLDCSGPILIIELNKDGLLLASLYHQSQQQGKNSQIIKVRLDWHKLQRRIVTAGRKSELLLQACKLTAESQVLDATAGFGHDSLIMASSGASVTMLENNPLMALLLLLERERMQSEKNWQGLMARLSIYYDNMLDLQTDNMVNARFDVIYLDPMFPNDSYAGAKVGKGMQVLHNLATPPTLAEEEALLSQAKSRLKQSGRVVVR